MLYRLLINLIFFFCLRINQMKQRLIVPIILSIQKFDNFPKPLTQSNPHNPLFSSPNPNKNRIIVSIISASRAVVLDTDLIPNTWPVKCFGGSGLFLFLNL